MDNTLVWADIPTRDLDRAMAFYSALLDVPVTPIQEEIRFAMLRHDGNNAAACLGPMDKYHQPGHSGPPHLPRPGRAPAGGRTAGAQDRRTGAGAPAQHRQRPWLPGHHRRYRGQLAGPLCAPRQLMTGGSARNNNGDLMVAVVHEPVSRVIRPAG